MKEIIEREIKKVYKFECQFYTQEQIKASVKELYLEFKFLDCEFLNNLSKIYTVIIQSNIDYTEYQGVIFRSINYKNNIIYCTYVDKEWFSYDDKNYLKWKKND